MQTNTPTIRSFAYKYGIIISIITIAFSLMIHFMDLTYSGSNLPQIVNYGLVIGWITGLFTKKNQA